MASILIKILKTDTYNLFKALHFRLVLFDDVHFFLIIHSKK